MSAGRRFPRWLAWLVAFASALTTSGPQVAIAATVAIPVSAAGDNGTYEGPDGFDTSYGALDLGNPFGRQGAGVFTRFVGVAVPPGANISSATIVFAGDANQAGTVVNLKIRALAIDNPSAPTSYAQISSVPRTAAAVEWSNLSPWTTGQTPIATPDLSSILQEIVDRPGWTSGNAVVLTLDDDGTTNQAYRQAHAYSSGSLVPQLRVTYSTARAMSATPAIIPTNASNVNLSLVGLGTGWTQATVFTLSAGLGVTTISQTVTDGTHATLVLATGPTPGTLTISDGTSSCTVTVNASGLIGVTDANWFWSPGTWQRNDPAWRQTNSQGYTKVGLTNTTSLSLGVDTTPQLGQPVANYPVLRWHLGEGPDTLYQLKPGDTSVNLASGLSATATYDLYLEVVFTTDTPDRWTPRANAVARITGLMTDQGGRTVSLAGRSNAVRPKIAYIEGDSITEGIAGNEASSLAGDAAWSYAHHLGWLLNAEYGQRGWAAEDLIVGVPTSQLPGLKDIWNLYSQSNSRLGEPAPDYVLVNIGTNDQTVRNTTPATFAAVASSYVAAMHTQWPNAKIFCIVPFGGFMRSGWQQTTLPPNTFLIDLGTGFQAGLDKVSPSWKTDPMKVHPTTRSIMELLALLGAKLQPFLP